MAAAELRGSRGTRGAGARRPRPQPGCRSSVTDAASSRCADQKARLMIRTVVVCEVQVPFVHGGAEIHVRSVVAQLQARGYESRTRVAALQVVPERGDPRACRGVAPAGSRARRTAAAIDRVIATKFPAYFVAAPAQGHVADAPVPARRTSSRAREYSDFEHVEAGRRASAAAGRTRYARCSASRTALFAGAANTGKRLDKYNGLTAETLYHPPLLADRSCAGPQGDYVLVVSRHRDDQAHRSRRARP